VGALITVETIVLILLALLVAGLLRSHAEILRRLESLDPSPDLPDGPRAAAGNGLDLLPQARQAATPAFDVAGTTLAGDPVKVAVTGRRGGTLLAFLSSGCLQCQELWEGLRPEVRRPAPGNARVVVVTKDSTHESPSRLHELAPSDVPVVMSSSAWDDYQVKGSPYFIYVDGPSSQVHGEGTAGAWPQVFSLLRDAFHDAEAARRGGLTGRERLARADAELDAAGIGPGHASLYAPGSGPGAENGGRRAPR
jgi:hypothetical protein